MNGKIWLDSQVDAGSTFYIEFPFINAEALNTLSTQDSVEFEIAEIIPDQTRAKVLLVEDDRLAAYIVNRVFEKCHATCDIVTSGEEAIRAAEEKKYDLILSDIGLPGVDGIATVKKILATQLNAETPFIGLTAYLHEDKEDHCLAAGMRLVIEKPLSIDVAKQLLFEYVYGGSESVISNINTDSELLTILVSALPAELKMMSDSYVAGDIERLADVVHKLYGGLCYCNLPALKHAVGEVYKALDAGCLQDIGSMLQVVEAEANKILPS